MFIVTSSGGHSILCSLDKQNIFCSRTLEIQAFQHVKY